jgi:chitinase
MKIEKSIAAAVVLSAAAAASAQVKVVGYAPSWEAPVADVQLARLTHVNYAFLNPNDGVAAANIPNSGQLSALVTAAHGRGVKVLLSVGGWTNQDNHAFLAAGADSTSASNFANSLMSLVTQFGLDGIDVDWKWPQAGDGSDVKYGNVVSAVCSKMHASSKVCSTALVGN